MEALLSSGNLEEGICWEKLDNLLRTRISNEPWTLLEQLTDHLGRELLSEFPAIAKLRVMLKKRPFVHADWVGVELCWER